MDYCVAGDLSKFGDHIIGRGSVLPEIVMAIDSVHRLGYEHRYLN